MASKPLHIVMFPWLAFGHFIPYLDLCKHLALKGHTISFVSTPRNIHRLPKLPPHLSSSISFISLPLPEVENLPLNAESTMDISPHQTDLLKKAFDSLQPAFTRFLEGSKPDWIFYDFAPYWLPPIAARLGISRAMLLIFNAWFLAYFGPTDTMINGTDYRTVPQDFTIPPKWVKFDTRVVYRLYEANEIIGASFSNRSGFSDSYRAGNAVLGCDAILLRHCYEFEPEWLGLLEELHNKRVVPLGLMPPKLEDRNEDGDTWTQIKDWLDGHDEGSVVYVAFGSETTPSHEQLTELAHGLELSGVPFFWVLRKLDHPSGFEEIKFDLPSGFEERVIERGIVWQSWAPQLRILDHKSVGACVTHCGWSSIVEALMRGHPFIQLPFCGDQCLNSRVMVQKQVGLEVTRKEDDGSYTGDSVSESIKRVMNGKEGELMRKRAKEMSKLFGDMELQSKYIDKLVEFLEDHTSTLKS